MKWKTILLTALVSSAIAAQGAEESVKPTSYELLRDTVAGLTLKPGSSRYVEGIFIEKGVFTLTLESGVISRMNDVAGRTIGYVFSGSGSVAVQPRMLTEQLNMKRFFEKTQFIEDFTSLTVLCTDNTIEDQLSSLDSVASKDTAQNIKLAESWRVFSMYNEGKTLLPAVARTILNSLPANFLQIRLEKRHHWSAYLVHDPYEVEPYTFYIEKYGNRFPSPFVVNRCPEPGSVVTIKDNGVDPGDLVSTLQHTISVDIDRSLDLRARDRLAMEVIADSVSVLDINLYPDLTIDSVSLPGGTALPVYRPSGYTSWVELPRALKKGEAFELIIDYHGDVIDRFGDNTVLKSSITWYPTHSYMHKAYYDVTFDFPEYLTLASVGSQNEMRTIGERSHSRWVTGRPIRNASFHIGFFERLKIETPPGIPKASILYNTPDQVDVVGIDMKQSLEFFTKLFGKLPIDSLIATELPGWHGEAFPGLLHLSNQAFDPSVWDDAQFFEERFIAHEVGHQWWGIAVDFESYRDQWLSEGFAQYSAYMYAQIAASDTEKLQKLLERSRDELLDFGKRDIGRDVPPPSIALGRRADDGALHNRGYHKFIYNKGAWVLHMLRNLLLNLDTMKDDAFVTVMKSFYHSYKNRRATTEDFRKTIEDVIGFDMQWYFNQWVYGNQIPEFTWAYSSSEKTDGTYANWIRVRQDGVEETFLSYIPIKVVYDDDTWQRFRIKMIGREATLKLPESATEIDEIIFNEFMSVLCEQDEESY